MEYKNETKICQNCKQDFIVEPEDFKFYEKIKVPPPTWCPECRSIRRMMWRNEHTWYHRKCDATGKSIISMYAPNTVYKVYDQEYWKSDACDPLDYGKSYDFSKGFFEQFDALFREIPHPSLIQKNNVNSDYSNHTLNLKNCYFCAGSDTAEDSSYFFGAVLRVKNCLDLHQSCDCEFCYELIDSVKSNSLFWGQNCESCFDSILLYDCKNCNNCFGCVGLRSKSYCIFNEQYSKEEYKKEINKYWDGGWENFKKAKTKFEELKLKIPRKYAVITKSINVTGDDILESRNCKQCFNVRNNIENCKFCYRAHDGSKDGYDAFIAWNNAELFYEVMSASGQNILFSAFIWGGFNVQYSENCFDCNNIFGCVGLRNKSYCILNKQYEKSEYEKIVVKIIEAMKEKKEYGEFFPSKISPFYYNEAIVQDYFPKSKKDAIEQDFSWRDGEEKNYTITVLNNDIPDKIKDVPDSFVKEIIECEHKGKCNDQCATAFKLTVSELQFYKKMNIPLPRLCPFCRHYNRLKLKNPMKLWHRKCMKENCTNEFETPYAPDRKEIIYCEQCYNREVY
ncbi:MAG: hypothetical protein WCS86_02100 [Candidatus Paceibacterota bacterium]